MFKVLLVLAFLGIFALAVAKPAVGPRPPTKPADNFNGTGLYPNFKNPVFDIKFAPGQSRSGIPGENYRWRGGFYVHPDRGFNQGEYEILNAALYDLSQILCIQVLIWPQDSNPTGDYVEMIRGGSGSGCWSYVGRLGNRQDLNLQFNGCISRGTVTHELIHALGYFHEQSRPDRDEHVQVLWDNISPDMRYNFDKYTDTQTFGVPYDTRSIMHYNSHDFSQNGQETLRAWNGGPVGSMGYMTGNDHSKLRAMYC